MSSEYFCFECPNCGEVGAMVEGAAHKLTERRICKEHGIPIGPKSIICSSSPLAVMYTRKVKFKKKEPVRSLDGWDDY